MAKRIIRIKQPHLAAAEKMAERLKGEPYHFLIFTEPFIIKYNCVGKSLRFIRECKRQRIRVKLVWCLLGSVKAKLPVLGSKTIPVFSHFWGEVDGQRIEVSRPSGATEHFGIKPAEIRPIISFRIPRKLLRI